MLACFILSGDDENDTQLSSVAASPQLKRTKLIISKNNDTTHKASGLYSSMKRRLALQDECGTRPRTAKESVGATDNEPMASETSPLVSYLNLSSG